MTGMAPLVGVSLHEATPSSESGFGSQHDSTVPVQTWRNSISPQ